MGLAAARAFLLWSKAPGHMGFSTCSSGGSRARICSHGALTQSLHGEIFQDQGWKPCHMHWQADSSPPEPPREPNTLYYKTKF